MMDSLAGLCINKPLIAALQGPHPSCYIPEAPTWMIAEHIEEHLPDNDADRWLFIRTGEEPPHQNTVGYCWRQARRRAGFVSVTLHDLRHFTAISPRVSLSATTTLAAQNLR